MVYTKNNTVLRRKIVNSVTLTVSTYTVQVGYLLECDVGDEGDQKTAGADRTADVHADQHLSVFILVFYQTCCVWILDLERHTRVY